MPTKGISAMTETSQLRARYARMYAAGIITVVAATVASAAWTKVPNQPAIDVSVIMSGVDTASLPVQGHVDAF
jgi:hypothetical protein